MEQLAAVARRSELLTVASATRDRTAVPSGDPSSSNAKPTPASTGIDA